MKTNSLLLIDNKNLFYITKVPFDGFWLLIHKNKFIIITSQMIYGQVKQHFKNKAKIFVIKTSFCDELITICKKYKINKLKLDITNINYNLFQLIKDKLKKHKISICSDRETILKKRIIKNKEEIKCIKKACDIVSEIFEIIKEKVVPGMKEIDIHFKIEEEFAKRHVVQSFKTIVASGPNSANPHHISGNRKIQKNDVVLIDMGCVYNGYCSDLTRTFFVGKEDKSKRKIWNIVKQAHDKALTNVKQNMKTSDIDLFARGLIKQEGYDKNFIHTTGHGVGIDILKEGMIITIEPGIYLENKFGVRIEDTVLVTKNGYKVLTSAKY